MKLKVPQSIHNTRTWEELRRYLAITLDDILTALNGRISVGDNLDGQVVSVQFSSANIEVKVPHVLQRVPVGYIPVNKSVAMDIYNGGSAFSNTNVFLKSSAAGSADIFIF